MEMEILAFMAITLTITRSSLVCTAMVRNPRLKWIVTSCEELKDGYQLYRY